ncbi:uncharacterized protein LOC117178074 isoform X1 [Belonocnema kinseyi]|uniref:uncharacterized protein LOC117178074 isoform X1 n=1 Tax=Belonocnema kinseyi TaxID=2817044 RepID=UPI00143D9AD5|nr:uncharacterized protein LOC117178074 isoform X1 [Belonocnema kinseyi]
MTSCKRIFALIYIIKLFVTSVSCLSANERIVPEGAARVLYGHGSLIAGRAGIDFSDEVDRHCGSYFIDKSKKLLAHVQYVRTFATTNNDTISAISVFDMPLESNLGGRIELLNGGPGYKHVTLKFTSAWNNRIQKYINLYCRDSPREA